MSFDKFTHQQVSELVKLAVTDTDLFSSYQPYELANFMEEIQKKLRGIQFGRISNRIYAYYPDEVFARGYVSYRDIRYVRSEPQKYTYNVSSPNIENNKTDMYNTDRFFRFSSANLNTAVRNAVKYLRAYTPTDIIRVTTQSVIDGRNTISGEEGYEIRKLSNDIAGTNVISKGLFNELMHLNNSGHVFIEPTYGKNVAEYFKLYDEHMHNEKSGRDYTFVLVKTVDGQHEFTCIDIKALAMQHSRINYAMSDAERLIDAMIATARVSTELPDDVLSKVSVLTLGEDDTFLDGVGYKYCDEVYYVYK